jgi:hypothetical protein
MATLVQQPRCPQLHSRIRTCRPSVRSLRGAALICAALLALTSAARAGENPTCMVCLGGAVAYHYQGDVADITITRVGNLRVGGMSGTLQLELWMTDGPYVGGTIGGYRVAGFQLAPLLGGYEYTNVDSGSIDFFPPPDGTYHVVLTLEEFDGSNFVIVDWDNLTTLATFGLVPPTPTTTTTTTTSPTIATTSTLPSRTPRGQCHFACMPQIQACRASCVAPGRKRCRMRCRPKVVRFCKATGSCS